MLGGRAAIPPGSGRFFGDGSGGVARAARGLTTGYGLGCLRHRETGRANAAKAIMGLSHFFRRLFVARRRGAPFGLPLVEDLSLGSNRFARLFDYLLG
jgi:hypothetical protein